LTAIRRSSGYPSACRLGVVEIEHVLHAGDVGAVGLDVEPGRHPPLGGVADVAIDHDHLALRDVGVLQLADALPLVAVDGLVGIAVGVVGDDVGAPLRPR
jgi:hypothetical protein